MMQFLELRARLRSIYQKYQRFIDPTVKFVTSLVVFLVINKTLGFDERISKTSISLLLAAVCAFTPSSILVLLAMAVTLAQVYHVAKLLSLLLILIVIIMYCFFIRYTPKFGYVVLGIPILFALKIPYVFPLLLGLIATPLTILPAGCGVVIYYLIHIVREEVEVAQAVTKVDDILPIYVQVINKIVQNKEMLFTIIIFALIIVVVYVIRRLKIEYAFGIAIASGAVAGIVGFLIMYLRLNQSKKIFGMIFGMVISALIVLVIHLFERVLDYTAVENVQFEDDDYYYYVKAVPKMQVSVPDIKVQKFSGSQEFREVPDDEGEDEDL